MTSCAQSYDVIVVGSGATGGWAAKELTQSGLQVLVLEAGRALAREDARPAAWRRVLAPAGADERFANQRIQRRHPAFHAGNRHFFIDDEENPYTHPDHAPFTWIRGRQVGGRSMVWGGQTWRLSDFELKAASADGIGLDWPLSYEQLRPSYDKVEAFIHVAGNRDGLVEMPDGRMYSQRFLTESEHHLKHVVESAWPERRVIALRSVVADAPAESFAGHTCWPRFSSPGSTLAAAEQTGRLTLRSDSVVSHLLMSTDQTHVRGVCFVDAADGTSHEVFGKAVVLCASTLESTRILLNTRSAAHPNGIGNRSGCLGRYLMDHVAIGIRGTIPWLRAEAASANGWGDSLPAAPRPGSVQGIYIPRFRNLKGPERGVGFRRGYGIWGGAQREARPIGRSRPATFFLLVIGEMLPDERNGVELAKTTDRWGIPVLDIHCILGENERRMVHDGYEQVCEMAARAGFERTDDIPLFTPGGFVHEVGTARMGADRNNSYLNPACQSWEVSNLFVTDGACWTTSAYQNPTLTMMAITVHACCHIRDEVARG